MKAFNTCQPFVLTSQQLWLDKYSFICFTDGDTEVQDVFHDQPSWLVELRDGTRTQSSVLQANLS
jgi:hypothetical protein